MSHELESWEIRSARFIASDAMPVKIPGADGDDPWADHSLRSAEKYLLGRFETVDDLPLEVFEEYQMYLGEGLRRAFDGRWTPLPAELLGEEGRAGWGVAYGRMDHVDVTDGMICFALAERSGDWWAGIFRSNRELMPG